MLAGDRLAHAYLLVGPEGVGRTAVAEALLRAVLGVAGGGALDSQPDFIRIVRGEDPETGKRRSAISVEQVRDLSERLAMTSLTGGRKAARVVVADRLNAASAYALLKTLEEPRGDAVIVLVAPAVPSVPATVASRCQVIRFHPVPDAVIADALARRGLDPEEALELARGRPGHALRLIADSAFRAEAQTSREKARRLLDASVVERLRAAGGLLPKDEADKVRTAEAFLDAWEAAVRDRMLARLAADPSWAVRSLRRCAAARASLRGNGNPLLCIEHALLEV
jgi:DNA polymerase-3 subunit delta'